MSSRRLTVPAGAQQGMSGCVAPRDPPQPPAHSPSSRKLSTHCSTARSWSTELTSRCEGQGTASSVLRAVWMLARLPAERGTRSPPRTARLVREWGHQDAGGHSGTPAGGGMGGMSSWGRRDGTGCGGGMEEAHPQEALDHARGGPGQSGLSPEQGAPGHPQAQKLRAPRAAAHPAPCVIPCPIWHAQAHRTFGDFSAGTAGRHHPQQVARPAARPSHGGWGWSHPVPTGTRRWQRSHSTPPAAPSLRPILVNH